jgi:hypothetical protein
MVGTCEHSNELSGFIKGKQYSAEAKQLLVSQEVFCSMQLVCLLG